MVHKVIVCLVLFQLGNDSFGQDFLGIFKNNKINTDHVHITNGVSSGMAQITVAENGERRFMCSVGLLWISPIYHTLILP
jgi:sugar/nucleoside kinase (ribokinase family)